MGVSTALFLVVFGGGFRYFLGWVKVTTVVKEKIWVRIQPKLGS